MKTEWKRAVQERTDADGAETMSLKDFNKGMETGRKIEQELNKCKVAELKKRIDNLDDKMTSSIGGFS